MQQSSKPWNKTRIYNTFCRATSDHIFYREVNTSFHYTLGNHLCCSMGKIRKLIWIQITNRGALHWSSLKIVRKTCTAHILHVSPNCMGPKQCLISVQKAMITPRAGTSTGMWDSWNVPILRFFFPLNISSPKCSRISIQDLDITQT